MSSIIQPLLKVRYGDFINPLPSNTTMASDIEFVPKQSRDGRSYNFPVYLKLPHGVTHDDTKTAFTLNAVRSAGYEEATLSGSSILVRDNVAYDDVMATVNGVANGGGAGGAYMSAWDQCTMGLMQSGELYRELALMYGPGSTSTASANIGVVNASVSGADLAAPQVVNLTRDSWAPGLWPNMIGALVDVYESDGSTLRAADVEVTAIAETTNRLTLSKSGSAVTVAAGDIILVAGAIDVSCYGIEAICQNTGELFGISAATYPQWKVVPFAVGSTLLDRRAILGMAAQQQARGLMGGATLYVSGPCVADLIEEAAELRRDNSRTDTVIHGASAISYDTPIGVITVKSHPYMKQGVGWLLPKGKVKRVGSTDLTFSGGKNEWWYMELPDAAGSQMRIFSSQAPIIECPWHAVYLTGIRSTYDTQPA